VRTFVIPLSLALSLAMACAVASVSARAEVIHLKNGDVIYVDRVKQNANNVQYEVGDNVYTIPMSRVQSVESGTQAPSAPQTMAMPAFTPEVPAGGNGELLEQIVHGHEVDRGVLAVIESRGNASETAIAYYIAAREEFQAGRFPDSRRDLETALRYSPQSPAVLNYYAAVLVRTGDTAEAITYADRAATTATDSPDAWAVLGFAQYSANHPRDAVQSWKKSLALRFDPSIQKMIDRAERESAAESNYSEREAGHFVLRYEGGQTSEAVRDQLLSTLEAHYQDLSREFETEPRSSIQVVLYTNQSFFDVTRAPAWMGALNDGKLRIPIEGLDSVTPELARVLRHELTHSFVNQISMGRCPQWLNEGVAQLLEPQSLGGRVSGLAQLYRAENELPLNTLERGFSSFSGAEARLAYDEALAAAQYLREHHGMSDVVRVMRQIGQGDSVESSMRSAIHSDYAHLEEELRAYLVAQAGN
jgi:tetratricopeptide (TPR) repeat protein